MSLLYKQSITLPFFLFLNLSEVCLCCFQSEFTLSIVERVKYPPSRTQFLFSNLDFRFSTLSPMQRSIILFLAYFITNTKPSSRIVLQRAQTRRFVFHKLQKVLILAHFLLIFAHFFHPPAYLVALFAYLSCLIPTNLPPNFTIFLA